MYMYFWNYSTYLNVTSKVTLSVKVLADLYRPNALPVTPSHTTVTEVSNRCLDEGLYPHFLGLELNLWPFSFSMRPIVSSIFIILMVLCHNGLGISLTKHCSCAVIYALAMEKLSNVLLGEGARFQKYLCLRF